MEGRYLTVEQVRLAADAWIMAQRVKPKAKATLFQQTVAVIRYRQDRNRVARVSHWKKTIRKLESLGIDYNEIRSCIPPDI